MKITNETKEQMMNRCIAYFNNLIEKLKDTHTLVKSCNDDCTMYLVPKGTEDQITYYSKPNDSYRFSDHWNWYANTQKCPDEHYVQCLNDDLPWPRRRTSNKATRPIWGIQVAYFDGKDEQYHHVYGQKFDKQTKEWSFE